MAGDGGYYVLTGDMESKSGIYVAAKDFSYVRPLAVGNQRFRAVRGFPVNDGLIYATDSAITRNHVFYLQEKSGKAPFYLERLGSLNGPCIYGGWVKGGYLFTTTVEPDESRGGIASFLSKRTGPGILDPVATAVLATEDGVLREIARIGSDGLPLKALQYASMQVPAGVSPMGAAWVYSRSLEGADGRAIKLNIGGDE